MSSGSLGISERISSSRASIRGSLGPSVVVTYVTGITLYTYVAESRVYMIGMLPGEQKNWSSQNSVPGTTSERLSR